MYGPCIIASACYWLYPLISSALNHAHDTLFQRRPSRKERPEEKNYGNDTATYEAIRVRVLQEKAVVNAIEALQERWRMIMFMYNDCQDLNKNRLDRRQIKLDIKRQEELILIILMFLGFLCVPIAILFIFISR